MPPKSGDIQLVILDKKLSCFFHRLVARDLARDNTERLLGNRVYRNTWGANKASVVLLTWVAPIEIAFNSFFKNSISKYSMLKGQGTLMLTYFWTRAHGQHSRLTVCVSHVFAKRTS